MDHRQKLQPQMGDAIPLDVRGASGRDVRGQARSGNGGALVRETTLAYWSV